MGDRRAVFAFVVGAWAGGLVAQATHLVGPGGFAQIQDAVNAAVSGDTILVQPGNYVAIFTTKGLTIRATGPGVFVGPGFFFSECFFNLGPGLSVHVEGLHLHALRIVSGSATIENVRIDSAGGILALMSTTAVLQDCTVQPVNTGFIGSSPSLQLLLSDVTAIDCVVHGAPGVAGGAYPGVAIDLQSSKLRGAGLDIFTDGMSGGAQAIVADAASSVWLADSNVQTAWWMCPLGITAVRLDRCTVTPACPSTPIGLVLGVHRPAPPQAGAPFTLEFRASPNLLLGVLCEWQITPTSLPFLEQTLLLPAASAFAAGVVITDATGFASATWNVPPGPFVTGQQLWFQAFGGTATPLQASPVAGGLVR